jgi:tRNA (guanosine-2'-O-)-methyltransferase
MSGPDDRAHRPLGGTDLKRLHRAWRGKTAQTVALLLDNVMTPYNVGAIARVAAAFRASPVWLAGATADVDHAGARKTALGTDRYLDVRRAASARDAAAEASAEGFTLVAVELTAGATPLFELTLPPAVCFVLGHEDHGVSSACLTQCAAVGYIPLVGKVGSLNVASAAGIALYEARRQEWSRAD